MINAKPFVSLVAAASVVFVTSAANASLPIASLYKSAPALICANKAPTQLIVLVPEAVKTYQIDFVEVADFGPKAREGKTEAEVRSLFASLPRAIPLQPAEVDRSKVSSFGPIISPTSVLTLQIGKIFRMDVWLSPYGRTTWTGKIEYVDKTGRVVKSEADCVFSVGNDMTSI